MWAPPENITVDEWADKYRQLPAGLSAESGQWRTSRTEYMREPMRAFTDPTVEEISVVAPSQVGKSELTLNVLCFIIDQQPGTVMIIHPNDKVGQKFVSKRIHPLMECNPRVGDRMQTVNKRGKKATSTITEKSFPGGSLSIVGSQSPSALASTPARYIIGDELDRFETSAGRDGDPWELAKRRQKTFYNKKRIAVSTPTIKGASQIEFLFNRGTQERWKTKCPHCGEFNEIVFDDIRFKATVNRISGKQVWDIDVQGWLCPACRTIVDEHTAKKSDSKWVADNPGALKSNKARSFWLQGWVSPWSEWRDLIQGFCEAKDNPERLKVVFNTDFGQLWEERSGDIEEQTLMNRAEAYPEDADLPDGVLFLNCAVDCQGDYMQYEIVGWGRYEESWGIRTGIIPHDPASQDAWDQLISIISRQYTFESGKSLYINNTCVDTGDGNKTNELASFCKKYQRYGVLAVKGSSVRGKQFISPPNKVPIAGDVRNKYWLYSIGTGAGKSAIMSFLKKEEPGPRFMHFPSDESRGYSFHYYQGLLSEIEEAPGVWKKIFKKNEPLDVRNYALAGLRIANPNFDAIERELNRELLPRPKRSSKPKRPRRSRGDEMFD